MARYSAADKEIDSVMREFNARPDDITAILKHRTDIKGHLGYLYIAHIEPKGNVLTIMYHPPPAHDEIRYELTLEPPVETIYDLKPRLRMMRDQARKHFTVPERPKIDYYSPPPLFPYVIPFIAAESLLAFAVFGWGSLADRFRALIQHYGGPYMLSVAQGFFALMHFFAEPAYILYQLRQHRTPISEGWKWLLTIVAVGFAGMDEWTECVEYEKLRHIYAKTDVGKLPPRLERFTVSKEKKDL